MQVLKIAFLILAITYLALRIYQDRDSFFQAVGSISALHFTLASVCVFIGLLFSMLSYRESLTSLGAPIPLKAAASMYYVSQIGKYIPGSVWPVMAQMEIGKSHGIRRHISAVAFAVNMIVSLATAIVTVAVTSLFGGALFLEEYWWLFLIAALSSAVLLPPVLNRALRLLLRITNRSALENSPRVHGPHLLFSIGWSMLVWIAFGMQAYFLTVDLAYSHEHLFTIAVRSFALAWAVGFVLVFLPAGVGAREPALVAGLAPVATSSAALAVAVVSRVIMTLADLVVAALGFAMSRRDRESTERVDKLESQ